MSDIQVGDRVRRVKPCDLFRCEFPPHQVGWEGTVSMMTANYLGVDGSSIPKGVVEKVEDEVTPSDAKGADMETSEGPSLSAAPDPAIRLTVLKLALDYGFGSQDLRKTVEVAEVFAAWVEGR